MPHFLIEAGNADSKENCKGPYRARKDRFHQPRGGESLEPLRNNIVGPLPFWL